MKLVRASSRERRPRTIPPGCHLCHRPRPAHKVPDAVCHPSGQGACDEHQTHHPDRPLPAQLPKASHAQKTNPQQYRKIPALTDPLCQHLGPDHFQPLEPRRQSGIHSESQKDQDSNPKTPPLPLADPARAPYRRRQLLNPIVHSRTLASPPKASRKFTVFFRRPFEMSAPPHLDPPP